MTGDRIFLDYDQAALDAQFDHAARVPSWRAMVERQGQRGADLSPAHSVGYGPDERQIVHLFPRPGGGHATIVFFHGGGWRMGGPLAFAHVAPTFHALGLDVALPGFVQRPDATLPEIVAQAGEAVGAVARMAGPVFLSGVSSGAHLAAMASVACAPLARGALLLCGMYDLEPVRLSSRNVDLGLDEPTAAACSPVRRVETAPQTLPPLVAAWGALESAEMARQANALCAAWRATGSRATAIAAAGRTHFDVIEDLQAAGSALHAAAQALLKP